jgi:hypothetical protein
MLGRSATGISEEMAVSTDGKDDKGTKDKEEGEGEKN